MTADHIARKEFTPQEHSEACPVSAERKASDEHLETGFGLAGGGFGAYGYCPGCGAIRWKMEDRT